MPDLELPDGRIIQGIPEGLSRKQVTDKLLKAGVLKGDEEWLNPGAIERSGENKPKISRAEAALTTAANIPFAPRIKAGIAAGIAKTFGGDATKNESFSNLYNEALGAEREKLGAAREEYPIQSLVTQLPADMAVGGKILKGVGLAGKGIGHAIGGAAGLSGLQAAGETKDLTDIGQLATDVGGAAAIGAVTSGIFSGLGKGFEKLFKNNPDLAAKKLTADQVKGLASEAYKSASEKGGILKPEFINSLIDKTSEFDKQTAIGKALTGNSPILEVKDALSAFRDKKLDLASLQELDEALGDKIDDYVENGVIKKAGLPLLKLQQSLRESINNASSDMIEGGKEGFEALKQGRALWTKAAKLRDVEKIITRAEMSDNPATALKTGFRTLASNPNKFNYFNDAEKKLIKEAAKTGVVTDALRSFGSRLIPIGKIVSGGGISGTLAGQATSMAARDLAARSQLARANKISQQILGNPQPETIINPLNPIIASRVGSQYTYKP